MPSSQSFLKFEFTPMVKKVRQKNSTRKVLAWSVELLAGPGLNCFFVSGTATSVDFPVAGSAREISFMTGIISKRTSPVAGSVSFTSLVTATVVSDLIKEGNASPRARKSQIGRAHV